KIDFGAQQLSMICDSGTQLLCPIVPASWPCSSLCPTWMRLIPSLLLPHHFYALNPVGTLAIRPFTLIKA
ncbi:hypothetical protein N7530_004666, partial [Penicillium desertorum]